jgi:hypothetical protein
MAFENVTALQPTTTFTPDQALESAKMCGPVHVLVIGFDAKGEFLMRSSRMDKIEALYLIEKARAWVMS